MKEIRECLATEPLREVGGKWYFRGGVDVAGETTDSFDRLKMAFKKFPRFYYFLIHVVSPVCSDRRAMPREKKHGIMISNAHFDSGLLVWDCISGKMGYIIQNMWK